MPGIFRHAACLFRVALSRYDTAAYEGCHGCEHLQDVRRQYDEQS